MDPSVPGSGGRQAERIDPRDDGNAGNNEVGVYASVLYIFGMNALKDAGF